MTASNGLFGLGYINNYQPHEKENLLTLAIREVFYSVRPSEKPKNPRDRGEWCLIKGCVRRKNEVSEMCDRHISIFGYNPKEKEDGIVLNSCRDLMENINRSGF